VQKTLHQATVRYSFCSERHKKELYSNFSHSKCI